MLRVFRSLLSVAGVLSLLLTLAVIVLLPRSYLRWDSLFIQVGPRPMTIDTADGVVVVTWYALSSPEPWLLRSIPANRTFGNEALTRYNAPENRHAPGVSWGRNFIAFPIGLLVIPGLLLSGFWVSRWRRWRQNRRRRLGQCVQCGYSLFRNDSGTCPECGTAISTNH